MNRILFVDDDAHVLEGLRDVLRKHERRWKMRFVRGGRAALDVLAQDGFDVVVTDLRMPDVDGFEVLDRVRTEYPATVRLVLSGDPRRESTLRAVPNAHRILVKPCRRQELEAALESACALGGLLADATLRERVGKISDLPPLPENAARLDEALDREVPAAEVANIVSRDIALSARVLKLASSTAFARGHVVASVGEAVARLGLDVLRTLEYRELPSAMHGFVSDLHDHSAVVARVATHLAPTPAVQRDAFTAAMLHDIGKLVLALEGSHEATIDHGRVGAYLLGLWGVPASVIDAVAHHHDDAHAERLVTRLVNRAERIVNAKELSHVP